MSQFTNYAENKLVDFTRGQGLTLPTNWYLALGSAGTDSSFTELTGTGYARQPYLRALAQWAGTQGVGTTLASTGTSHATSNNDAISWGNPGSAWGTANDIGVFDASTSGNCWMVIPIRAIVITTGSPNPVQIDAGALRMTLGLLGGMSDYLANAMIDLLFRGQSFSWPSSTWQAVYTVTPMSSGGGTEVGGGGSYARVEVVSSLANWSGTQGAGTTVASTGTAGRTSNNAAVTFPSPTGSWGALDGWGQLDASTSGNLLFSKAFSSPQSITSGGPAPHFAADAIGITFA